MQVERPSLDLSERELRFGRWVQENGVGRFLFDLDDTISATRHVIHGALSQAANLLATDVPINSRDEWREQINTIDSRLFEQHGVNAKRWNFTVNELAERYCLGEEIKQKMKQIFQQIYVTPLEMLEGAKEGLDFIKRVGVPIGIVTHAGSEWTLRKYNWLNLKRYVAWDEVYIVDENGHKTSESWAKAIRFFGLTAIECAVVGDSPRSDINPAWEAGVRHCFLVEDTNLWAIHNQPVNQSVRIIGSLSQIAEAVLGQQLSK
ncbi:hypothetical protein A2115_00770 [Candidatus Woesebacteria bacterium GWA1_41_8]|uniref:HAD family hydrolase n=1 Tax=Candidatus Woesebacteria bacterium GWA1_41_8 TaxID=1802471 RepID=A0A1F7WI47_9BACT|nr:MAG: hypothetical protein A2115_00770 [Candidatus Woesebacteria bacterium GWA1_41_8]